MLLSAQSNTPTSVSFSKTAEIEQNATASNLIRAAETLLPLILKGTSLDSSHLRAAMEGVCGGTDAEGCWNWREALEALEICQLLFLRRFLPAMRKQATTPAHMLTMLGKFADLAPNHTRRSEDSVALQQFSTPVELAFLVAHAARLSPDDVVLEPSAGTGMLAIHAVTRGAALHLNELAEIRRNIIQQLFPAFEITGYNAEHLHDILDPSFQPSVVLMNPPFSAAPNITGTMAGIDLRHVRSALNRLAPGGRLVAITSQGVHPDNPRYAEQFQRMAREATIAFTAPLSGAFFKRHGTTIETRLTVIDKQPGGSTLNVSGTVASPAELLDLLEATPLARASCAPALGMLTPGSKSPAPARKTTPAIEPTISVVSPTTIEVEYAERTEAVTISADDALYQPYTPERIAIVGAQPHPTKLVQSAAMASVKPPLPAYRPHLPAHVITDGILSEAQLESLIYAGEAHSGYLAGKWKLNDNADGLIAASENEAEAVQFRRGWFLGDGTGAGKGRQVAGIILDNFLKGRNRALWVSKSDTLLEDAQRDWTALGQEKLTIVPQSRFKHGKPITLGSGILFTTYATLRSAERQEKVSRLQQLVDWLGNDFDGVIVFDEAHAMGNAAGGGGERGKRAASQQGVAGLKLQHLLPHARIVYVSATGATTVENLAYAQRLGLWGSNDMPFANRSEFVTAMENGGIASSEVLARDLKSLGLYAARSLSYDGIEVEVLEHELTPEQVEIYDAYADAYQLIHNNLEEALKATNVTGENGATLSKSAKSAARSAFESTKLRFFNHLITAMKVPSAIKAITADLEAGYADVVQLVSTSEALLDRRLAEIPPAEWQDLTCDVTPREYCLSYLEHSFPTQLFEIHLDEKGNKFSVPVIVDGHPVQCREAGAARDQLLEQLGALPPVQSALDQLIHHFGEDKVAEITGRSRRILRKRNGQGFVNYVANRPASSNITETQAFMDDKKRVLIFSDAGGTGRSYHADLNCLNTRQRIHNLLEAGWKADAAVQALGRTNRTNQAQPPRFRPITTNVRGEKRFTSTIARRLDSLGAITRGQRQTGSQGMFQESDNLESIYAYAALRAFYLHLHAGKVPAMGIETFEQKTGLKLRDKDGMLLENLPRMSTFLNRMLALRIADQNALFEHFEGLIEARVQDAITKGKYDIGLETITAESITVLDNKTVATHRNGATTSLIAFKCRQRSNPRTFSAIQTRALNYGGHPMWNERSGRFALCEHAPAVTLESGEVQKRIRLVRPTEISNMAWDELQESNWSPCAADRFEAGWKAELENVPEYTTRTFHLLTGLLLPIWKDLPGDNTRVYRLTTDDGQRWIGRVVAAQHLHVFDAVPVNITPEAAYGMLMDGAALPLTAGLGLKRVLSMGQPRIELTGFTHHNLARLKTYGLFSEIIAYQTRLFVPTGTAGPDVLKTLLAAHPITGQSKG